jgi:hypothetical protein
VAVDAADRAGRWGRSPAVITRSSRRSGRIRLRAIIRDASRPTAYRVHGRRVVAACAMIVPSDRRDAGQRVAVAVAGKVTPVSSSDTVHSRC